MINESIHIHKFARVDILNCCFWAYRCALSALRTAPELISHPTWSASLKYIYSSTELYVTQPTATHTGSGKELFLGVQRSWQVPAACSR